MRTFLAALAVAGVVLVAVGLNGREGPPSPSDAVRTWDGKGIGRSLPASPPVRLVIPSIDVRARLTTTDVRRDGTLRTPPLEKPWLASWYRRSVSPGEAGAAVLLGHVDSEYSGRAVFYRLGSLRSGARIEVTRRDGTTAVFRVRRLASFPREDFPTGRVFGGADGRPELRLVTCGGAYDADRGYRRNVVAFAVMVDAESAGLF